MLDVGINKTFKDYLKEECEKFILINANVDNACPKIGRKEVANWIHQSWMCICPESIVRIWESIGFVNNNN